MNYLLLDSGIADELACWLAAVLGWLSWSSCLGWLGWLLGQLRWAGRLAERLAGWTGGQDASFEFHAIVAMKWWIAV